MLFMFYLTNLMFYLTLLAFYLTNLAILLTLSQLSPTTSIIFKKGAGGANPFSIFEKLVNFPDKSLLGTSL